MPCFAACVQSLRKHAHTQTYKHTHTPFISFVFFSVLLKNRRSVDFSEPLFYPFVKERCTAALSGPLLSCLACSFGGGRVLTSRGTGLQQRREFLCVQRRLCCFCTRRQLSLLIRCFELGVTVRLPQFEYELFQAFVRVP